MKTLTVRQRQVLDGWAAGLTNEEIARRLGLSVWTVHTHAGHVRERLGTHHRAQAVAVAYRTGLLDKDRRVWV